MHTNPSNPNLSTIATPTAYMSGRKKYARPQAMLWSNNPGTIINNLRIPEGIEKEDFIICSDHNRKEIQITQQRIETRQRMINGTMRSYHIADKINISVSWDMLPSRSFSRNVLFDENGKPLDSYYENGNIKSGTSLEYTVDGGAGGVELLDWYETHSNPFYIYLGYDKFNSPSNLVAQKVTDASFNMLGTYNDVRLMYFSGFSHTIQKRGGSNHDLWSISVSLEEV
jgi:hypothetical protein